MKTQIRDNHPSVGDKTRDLVPRQPGLVRTNLKSTCPLIRLEVTEDPLATLRALVWAPPAPEGSHWLFRRQPLPHVPQLVFGSVRPAVCWWTVADCRGFLFSFLIENDVMQSQARKKGNKELQNQLTPCCVWVPPHRAASVAVDSWCSGSCRDRRSSRSSQAGRGRRTCDEAKQQRKF